MALHIIDAYHKTNPDSLVWTPPAPINKLTEPGGNIEEIIGQCQDEISDFVDLRREYLLYR